MPKKHFTPDVAVVPSGSILARSRKFWLVATLIAGFVYGCVFLWLPLREGVVGAEGETISRARYVFSSLLYPEMRLSTWVDGGRLPVGFSDRIPILIGTCGWLGLSALIGLPFSQACLSKCCNMGLASRAMGVCNFGRAWASFEFDPSHRIAWRA